MTQQNQPIQAQVPQPPPPAHSFYGLGIAPKLLEILDRMKFTVPTPIQHKAIPILNEGKDIIGIAQTGTGKTLAFGIPTVQHLAQRKGRALVLVPTRELAIQVEETIKKIAAPFGLKTAVLIGGASMFLQVNALRANPRFIIATPGRLIDHLEQRSVMLGDVNMLVLDEADRMLDMGFQPQIERILRSIPKERQTMLFSATMPEEIVKIANTYMKLPVRTEIARSGTTVELLIQELFIVKKEAKNQLLKTLLDQYRGSVLLFMRTKIGAHKITRTIRAMNHNAAEIHSDRSLAQRREALEGFKTGKYRVLVATDIAARGIDVKGIELVINYDLPDDAENYVHRIGRTARTGHEGRAISLATPDQRGDVRNIERLIRTALPLAKHPEFPPEPFVDEFEDRRGFRPGGGGGYRSYGNRPQRPHGGGHGFKKRRPGGSSGGYPRQHKEFGRTY
jgi:ATP-dependent RNA helicase RhlE